MCFSPIASEHLEFFKSKKKRNKEVVMKVRKLNTLLIAIFFGLCGAFNYSFADEPGIIEVGGACNEEGLTYNLTTDILKSPWELYELYAVPVGTLSPDSWEQASSFNIQFQSELESGDSIGYAAACSEVWQNFFDDAADVVFNVHRTITGTNQLLECISGSWIVTTTEPLEVNDVSDWLKADGSPFGVSDPSSQTILQNNLQSLLDNLNSQPGADSEP
jgi:hypothetical protein